MLEMRVQLKKRIIGLEIAAESSPKALARG